MDHLKTRLRVEGLEDRSNPSTVSFEQGMAALAFTQNTTAEVHELYVTLNDPRTTAEIGFIGRHFQDLANASRVNQGVLSAFQSDLVAQPSPNTQLISAVGAAQQMETVNAAYASWMATGFGAVPTAPPAVPPVSPPPLPTPPDDASANAPVTPTDPIVPVTPPAELPLGVIPTTLSTTIPDINDSRFIAQADGLKIWDVARGTGPAVKAGDQVTVNYTGFLASNGTVFDSSQKPGRTPLSSTLDTSHLIQGFVEGVTGMQVGAIRRIFIPSALGYGTAGQGNIPPNADLVFEIQLLSSP